ncbi:MAG TPA: 23S rRNA (adenine(2503)-C(2))-methyltransferase RlmN [Myxococcales bacterium]|nr:23S rRNA (adenine(2503)-C(2))-methyltransferase RlmN [Myxococcales bacterium]
MTQAALEGWARERGATPGAARTLARHLIGGFAGRDNGEHPSRALLEEAAGLQRGLPACEAVEARDGTVRFAITLDDGEIVEAVLIRQQGRETVCVSSQVGCARGCVFCETGRLGLVRNLTAAEIVSQYALALRHASSRPTNVVFMGMGEPLDNLNEVIRAIEVLREPSGFAVPERRITVSTVGIVSKMAELFQRTKARVAVSLHAIEESQRLALLPVARRWSLAELRRAIAEAPRSVLLQWTLIEGINDSLEQAERLADFAQGLDVRVNLIPLNPGPIAAQRAPPIAHCRAFQKRLADLGVRTLLRLPHGQEAFGACGQLAGSRRLSH